MYSRYADVKVELCKNVVSMTAKAPSLAVLSATCLNSAYHLPLEAPKVDIPPLPPDAGDCACKFPSLKVAFVFSNPLKIA